MPAMPNVFLPHMMFKTTKEPSNKISVTKTCTVQNENQRTCIIMHCTVNAVVCLWFLPLLDCLLE